MMVLVVTLQWILRLNFDPLVCYDDGSCVAPVLGCTDPSASNYDASANTTIASGGAVDNTFGTGRLFLWRPAFKILMLLKNVLLGQLLSTLKLLIL